MSRRFGRNQKRRMREEMAAKDERVDQLTAGMAMDRALLRKTSNDLSDLRKELIAIASRVGRYAIAAGVAHKFDASWLERGHGSFRMHVPQPVPCVPSYGAAMPDTIQISAEVMRLLDIEAVSVPMSRDLHCRVMLDTHVIGYALSDHALCNLSRDELVRRMTPEIAEMLERELRRAGVR